MRRFVGSLCFLALAFVPHSVAQDDSDFIVVLAGKTWSLNGTPVKRGQTLKPSSDLQENGSQPSDLVLGCGKAGWLSYSCVKVPCTVKSCQLKDSNVDVHRVDPAPRDGSAIAESGTKESWFSSLFRREPATLAVLGVREGGHITGSVLRSTGSEVHAGPALTRVLEGKYCLRFTPLPPGDSSAARTVTIDWDRSTDPEGVVQLPNLKPGLYVLDKSDSEAAGACTFPTDATPAWVLVSANDDFNALNARWKEYTTQMRETERVGASPTVLLTIRHAALAHLADSVAPSK
jgi:hypothetical protein